MSVTFEPNDSQQTRVVKLDQVQADLAVSPVIDFEPNDSEQTRVEKLDQLQTEAGISPPIDFEPNDSQQTRAAQLNGMQGGSSPLAPPFTDATHYWKCNEASGNLLDEISSLDLTVNGATQHISGPLDFALQVNGHGAAANAYSVPTPSVRSGGVWTVNFWTKKIGTLNQDDIFSQYNNFTTAGSDIEFFMKAGVLHSTFSLYDGSAATNTSLTIPAGLFDGNWHMLTIRFGTTPNTLDFYLDGIAWGSATNSRSPNSTSTSIYFGQFNSSGAGTAQGIADVCIWPRALSDSEITMLYNGGTPLRP